ncbi:MAG: DNA repair protein RecN [Candidatus Aminicenantales bacterium]
MIKSFRIQNLATIEDIQLDLDRGFSILTGETGAGKSIIIDGIRLVLGEKGSADIIRTGKKETSIEAVFRVVRQTPELRAYASEPEGEVLIQRKIPESGSGRTYINGVLVPLKKLRSLRDDLVDIYGQNDHIFLQRVENQLDYLDVFGETSDLHHQVAQTARNLKRLLRQKRELESQEKERERRLDFLNFQIQEIEKAHLHPHEEEDLHQERNILKNTEKIRVLVEEALDLSSEKEPSLIALISRLQRTVEQLATFDECFAPAREALAQAAIAVGDLSDSLIKFKEKHQASPERLEQVEKRLSLVEELKRKYGGSVPEILAYKEKAQKEVQDLEHTHERGAELDQALQDVYARYVSMAHELSKRRKAAALRLEKEMEKQISVLGMKRARFKIGLSSSPVDKDHPETIRETGVDEVEFLISPNPGEDLRPLRKIASGGELSRVMLALKSIGKEAGELKTLVFDEIDSGIGGKTAERVAQRLRDLAKHHQVLCVTHLPQIASYAIHHFRIDKKVVKGRTFTVVKKLNFEERVEEIARLLAGTRITPTALENAREMLTHNCQISQAQENGHLRT